MREKQAREWLDKGDEDLNDAKILFNHGGNTGTICYLSQQAVEKYLKGFLIFNNKSFHKIHDLLGIAADCAKINPKFLDYKDALNKLTAYYIETRYPVPFIEEYSREEAEEAIEMSERIIGFIMNLLKKNEEL